PAERPRRRTALYARRWPQSLSGRYAPRIATLGTKGPNHRERFYRGLDALDRAGNCSAISRTSAPSRARAGWMTGMSSAWNGAAVTGPTQAARTGPHSA